MKTLKMYVDRYGHVNVPVSNDVKFVSGYFLNFINNEQGQYLSSFELSIMFNDIMIDVSVEKISDNRKDFNKTEIELSFNDNIVTIKCQPYIADKIITETNTIELPYDDFVIFQNQTPYSIQLEFLTSSK